MANGNVTTATPRGQAEDLLAEAARWRDEGQTWGSSPRPVGSQLIVDDSLRLQGSVSGGCIEGAVVHEAQAIMAGAPPKLLEFGVTDEEAWDVGLACGGTVKVFVERVE